MDEEYPMKSGLQAYRDREGATAATVVILLVVLIGCAALALDIGHIMVVRGELQNAADAGALNGARVLYTEDASGHVTDVNSGAAGAAQAAATENKSDNSDVEVSLSTDVQLGHWDGTTFTPSASTDPADINAVRVTAHRSSPYSIFAGIFGSGIFPQSKSAIAYRGYAGYNTNFDQPIAICWDRIVDEEGNFDCTTGRMFSNGSGSGTTEETARWTNFSEECEDSANTGSITNMVCGAGYTPGAASVSTSNGEVTPALTDLYHCWAPNAPATMPTSSWEIVLPVVKCVSPPTCSTIVAAVKVKVVWITSNGTDANYDNIPRQMEDWSASANCPDMATKEGRMACWNNFSLHFGLQIKNPDGSDSPATYNPATIYFKPECEAVTTGEPGGLPSDVISKVPKLVN